MGYAPQSFVGREMSTEVINLGAADLNLTISSLAHGRIPATGYLPTTEPGTAQITRAITLPANMKTYGKRVCVRINLAGQVKEDTALLAAHDVSFRLKTNAMDQGIKTVTIPYNEINPVAYSLDWQFDLTTIADFTLSFFIWCADSATVYCVASPNDAKSSGTADIGTQSTSNIEVLRITGQSLQAQINAVTGQVRTGATDTVYISFYPDDLSAMYTTSGATFSKNQAAIMYGGSVFTMINVALVVYMYTSAASNHAKLTMLRVIRSWFA